MSRRPVTIDEPELAKIEALAAQGLTQEQIARSLGFSARTLSRKIEDDGRIVESIKNGKAKGIATITNALFQSAKKGNVTAQIFFLKNQSPGTWKDRLPEVHPSDGPPPQRVEIVMVDGRVNGGKPTD